MGGELLKNLERLLESFSWGEANALGSLDLDSLTGLRVDSLTGLTIDNLESTKTDQLEALVLLDEGLDAVDDGSNDLFGVSLGCVFAKGLLDGFNEVDFAAHGLVGWLFSWFCRVTILIQKKPSLAVNSHCEKMLKNLMNTYPADDPKADLSHPEHLDYFKQIVREHMDRRPFVHSDAYVAPGAFLAGAVRLGARASVWPSASLRGDIAPIEIGEESNVQDNAVIHVATGQGVLVGRRVTIGHGAIVHACTIGDESLIGMGAIILDGAAIGERCLIGAHATVLMNTVIPPGSMVVGSPARIIRALSAEEQHRLASWADHYLIVSAEYKRRGIVHPVFSPGKTGDH